MLALLAQVPGDVSAVDVVGDAAVSLDPTTLTQIIAPYMGVFFAAFFIAIIATPLMRMLAIRNGIVDLPDLKRKNHLEPVAYLGGVAIFLGWLIAIGLAYFLVPEDDVQMLRRLEQHEGALVAGMRQSVSTETLRELRLPGSQALWLATNLRTEARSRDSRRVAETYRADLESEGISSAWYYLGQERLARADLAIGGTYTDEDEPLRAQEVLLRALGRLEDLERRMAETGASATDLAPTHSLMADVLVGLAVNSNVKLGRAEEALVWYERAYALRQDEFMGVLLACYRARMGRTEEARALLARTKPGPGTYYNLACTHALLGDTADALKFLDLDLRESHTSQAARNKQRSWASADPDLLGLREDPRFQELVRPR